MERKEVTIYAMTVDDSRSVPINAIRNTDGTYSLPVVGANGSTITTGAEKVSFTNFSGTLAANNEAQQIMPINLNRKYLLIQNVSAITMWINFNTDATLSQPAIKLIADGSFVMEASAIVTDSISIIGATAGSQFTAKEG